MGPAVLHNVTIYVERSEFEAVRGFYSALSGGSDVWQEPGHIACFGSAEVALCVHEEEPGHDAGAREFFFWVDDMDGVEAAVREAGTDVQRVGGELRCADPEGNLVRLHARRA